MRQMTAERQEMHAEADVLAREWQGAYAKEKANGRVLHDLMHEVMIDSVSTSSHVFWWHSAMGAAPLVENKVAMISGFTRCFSILFFKAFRKRSSSTFVGDMFFSTIPLLLQNPKVLVGYDAEVI